MVSDLLQSWPDAKQTEGQPLSRLNAQQSSAGAKPTYTVSGIDTAIARCYAAAEILTFFCDWGALASKRLFA